MIVKQLVSVENVISIYEVEIKVMFKVTRTQFLSSILQWMNPFLDIRQSMLFDRKRRLNGFESFGDKNPYKWGGVIQIRYFSNLLVNL
jgi:hypothetical protein